MTFIETAARLGFAELKEIGENDCFFHGCLSESAARILSAGLRTRPQEPCLTLNPASALSKYANPGLNSNNVYSGRVWKQVDALVAAKAIAGSASRQDLLPRAIAYWKSDPHSGAGFLLDLSGHRVGDVKAGRLYQTANTVGGGISKWVYAHLAVEPELHRGPATWVPPSCIIGYMVPSRRWTELFERYDPLKQRRIPTIREGSEWVRRMLRSKDCFVMVDGTRGAETVALSIVRRLAICLLYQELRKALLMIMAAHGLRIIKTDFLPASEWPVGAATETNARLAWLKEAVYEDEGLNATKNLWLDELAGSPAPVRQAPKPLGHRRAGPKSG